MEAAVMEAARRGAPWDRMPAAMLALVDGHGNEITGSGYKRQLTIFTVDGHPPALYNCTDITFSHRGASWFVRVLNWCVGWAVPWFRTAWPNLYGFKLYAIGPGEDGADGDLLAEGSFPHPLRIRNGGAFTMRDGLVDAEVKTSADRRESAPESA
jgi:hypothetical protein